MSAAALRPRRVGLAERELAIAEAGDGDAAAGARHGAVVGERHGDRAAPVERLGLVEVVVEVRQSRIRAADVDRERAARDGDVGAHRGAGRTDRQRTVACDDRAGAERDRRAAVLKRKTVVGTFRDRHFTRHARLRAVAAHPHRRGEAALQVFHRQAQRPLQHRDVADRNVGGKIVGERRRTALPDPVDPSREIGVGRAELADTVADARRSAGQRDVDTAADRQA